MLCHIVNFQDFAIHGLVWLLLEDSGSDASDEISDADADARPARPALSASAGRRSLTPREIRNPAIEVSIDRRVSTVGWLGGGSGVVTCRIL